MKIITILCLFALISASTGCSWLKSQWGTEAPLLKKEVQSVQKDKFADFNPIFMTPELPPLVQDLPGEKVANT